MWFVERRECGVVGGLEMWVEVVECEVLGVVSL